VKYKEELSCHSNKCVLTREKNAKLQIENDKAKDL
jgi:hypothetical protein